MIFSYKTADCAEVKLTERVAGEIFLLDVDVVYPEPTVPAVLTVKWTVNCVDMYSTWRESWCVA